MSKLTMLAVDDDPAILDSLELRLSDEVEIYRLGKGSEALDVLERTRFDIVLADYNLQDSINGFEIFKKARVTNPFVTACLMTGDDASAKISEAFEALGGIFVRKPFEDDDFDRMLNVARVNRERQKTANPHGSDPFSDFVAETPKIKRLLDQVRRCAPQTDLSIHFAGPTGTGKSTFAEIVHRLSVIKGPFKIVTCSTISEELASSQLFGHVKGAYTGATSDHEGLLALANGGTLLLDELHLLPKSVQGKLLRFLQTGLYNRLGEEKIERRSHVRLLTAASVNILDLVSKNEFMPDLWFRISMKVLHVPALVERRECMPKLIGRVLEEISQKAGQRYVLSPEALTTLSNFSWDGNIRDLRNCLRSLCADVENGQAITKEMVLDDLPNRAGRMLTTETEAPSAPLQQLCRDFERKMISQALAKHGGKIVTTAQALGIPRQTLRSKIITYRLGAR